MDFLTSIVLLTTVGLAINVGGNNSAAEMGPAFGAGVRSKKEAVLLVAVFSMMGAILAGGNVLHTIANEIVPGHVLRDHRTALVVILGSATLVIMLANCLRVPVATSHAMIGALAGVGVYYDSIGWQSLKTIVAWWLVTPLVSLILSYLLGRYLYGRLESWTDRIRPRRAFHLFLRVLITFSGCFMAFSAGSNSLAKAVGPVVGAGMVSAPVAAAAGGLGMAAGALLIGHRLLNTVGKGITPICPLKAALVELTCGTIVLFASRSGVPVSLAEIITCSIIGFGCAHTSFRFTANNNYVRTIYKLWPACPLATAIASFGVSSLVKVFHLN